ncbi:MAG: hypothetical protein AAF351_00145 [Pseudomonadota bacterium]
MTERNDEQLMQSAAQLATEISPQRDLWAGIEQQIQTPARSRWTPRLAQAAAVMLAIGVTAVVAYTLGSQNMTTPSGQVIGPLTFEQVALGPDRTFDSVYSGANGPLSIQLEEELAKLPPEMRTDIESNLAMIRQAIEEIHTALEAEPDNAFLQALLMETYRKELGLVNDVSRITQRNAARSDI